MILNENNLEDGKVDSMAGNKPKLSYDIVSLVAKTPPFAEDVNVQINDDDEKTHADTNQVQPSTRNQQNLEHERRQHSDCVNRMTTTQSTAKTSTVLNTYPASSDLPIKQVRPFTNDENGDKERVRAFKREGSCTSNKCSSPAAHKNYPIDTKTEVGHTAPSSSDKHSRQLAEYEQRLAKMTSDDARLAAAQSPMTSGEPLTKTSSPSSQYPPPPPPHSHLFPSPVNFASPHAMPSNLRQLYLPRPFRNLTPGCNASSPAAEFCVPGAFLPPGHLSSATYNSWTARHLSSVASLPSPLSRPFSNHLAGSL